MSGTHPERCGALADREPSRPRRGRQTSKVSILFLYRNSCHCNKSHELKYSKTMRILQRKGFSSVQAQVHTYTAVSCTRAVLRYARFAFGTAKVTYEFPRYASPTGTLHLWNHEQS